MTIEEFYYVCKNCTPSVTFEVWSFHDLIVRDTFSLLNRKVKNLHVQSFQIRKGKIIIYVRECVR